MRPEYQKQTTDSKWTFNCTTNMVLLGASIITSEDTQDDIDSITKVVMIANSVFVLGIYMP